MGGLFSILTYSSQALQTQQQALEVVKNNIANVNTEGYARQRAHITENDPVRLGNLIYGQGASVSEIQTLRDKYIEIRLAREQCQTGYYETLSSSLSQLEQIFDESQGTGLQTSLTEFFGSLMQLSADPSNTSLRQNVLLKADILATDIRTRAADVLELKDLADTNIQTMVAEANRLMEEIDGLNKQIIPIENGGLDAGGLRDRRNLALQELGKLMDISYYDAPNGGTLVSTATGRALVTEAGFKQISTGISSTGSQGITTILLDGEDITQEMRSRESGKIGAQLDFQADMLNGVTANLDLFVQDLRDRFNAVHAQGYDLNGNAGTAFFAPASGSFQATDFRVSIQDPALIAAAGEGTTAGVSAGIGDNTNVKALFEISNKLPATSPIPAALNNLTYGNFLLTMTTNIANKVTNTESALESQQAMLLQLERQRESVSGVSLDEEAADVIRYQKAFQSSSRFFNIINSLTDELLNMVG